MAQLSDDCFAFGGELMRADEALAILAARVSCVAATEEVALRLARGRILAEDVDAPRDVPPHDNAAVDDYHQAGCFTDSQQVKILTLIMAMAPYFSMPFPTILTYRTVLILFFINKINTVPCCRYS